MNLNPIRDYYRELLPQSKPRYRVRKVCNKKQTFIVLALAPLFIPFPLIKNLKFLNGYKILSDGLYKITKL